MYASVVAAQNVKKYVCVFLCLWVWLKKTGPGGNMDQNLLSHTHVGM